MSYSQSSAPVWQEPFNAAKSSELRPPFHLKKVQCADWNRDGRKLASGGAEKVICLWDVHHSRGSAELELKGHSDTVDVIRWNPTSSEQFASTGLDASVRLWDTRKGATTASFAIPEMGSGLTWSLDGTTLYAVCSETLFIYDVRRGAVTRSFKIPEALDALVITGATGQPELWIAGGAPVGTLEVYSTALDGKGQLQLQRSVRAHTHWLSSLSHDSANNRVAVGSADGLISLWHVDELSCAGTLEPTDMQQVNRTSVSFDGKYLAAGLLGSLEIFSLASFSLAYRLPVRAPGLEVTAVAWSPTANIMSYAIGLDDSQDAPLRRDHNLSANLFLMTNLERSAER